MGTPATADVQMGATSVPYIAAADGALRAAGWWTDETAMLVGLSGLGFHVVADPGTCPSSPTAYDWSVVHTHAARRIGITSTCVECVGDADTFEARRQEAVGLAKRSLDREIPVVVRTFDYAEFAVLTGYDDDDEVFFAIDSTGDPDPILYANLGKPHGRPMLFAQVFDERHAYDIREAARSSLAYGVECWRGTTSWGFSYGSGYRIGAEAFGVLIDVVERASSDPLGLRYILKILADARTGIATYCARLRDDQVVAGIEPVADRYAAAAELELSVSSLLSAEAPWERPLDADVLPEGASLLRRAADAEEEAIVHIERILA